jgi:hypothetical protein
MPADWGTFIQEVSDKLSSKEIANNDDLSVFLSDQYSKAVVGKAQSPFGNTHQAGNKQIITTAMKRAFDELERSPSPTFVERELDPLFSQSDEKLPTPESAILQDEKSYLKWAEENPQKSPNFLFFQFTETGQKLPTELKDSAKIIARRILFQDDGSQNFLKWVSLLNFGYLSDFGKVVQDEYKKLITGLSPSQIIFAKNRIRLSRKIFQPSYSGELSNLPNYVTPEFIAKFTFTGTADLPLDYLQRIGDKSGISSIVNGKDPLLKFGVNFVSKIKQYGNPIEGEYKKYYDSLQIWISSLAEVSQQEENERDPNDPYEIIAGGIINYWKSTLQQPLSSNPPVPPCVILPPGLGLYIPISYGNKRRLADLLRRAFNSGKIFKIPGTEKPASLIVSTGLAVAFATHLLELKFIYQGGITTPAGPSPMIGFIPLVF